MIYLTPNHLLLSPFNFNYSGLKITKKENGIFVSRVMEKSPAFLAGFSKGDQLISINDLNCSDLLEVRNTLNLKGKDLVVKIKRDHKELTLYLLPQKFY